MPGERSAAAAVLRSFRHAFRGLWHVVRRERNARIHLVFAVLALAAGLLLRLPAAQLAVVLLAIALVFLAEVVNSAIEKTLDIVNPEHDARIGAVKDMAAAAVLVAAAAAVVVGLVVFGPYLLRLTGR